MPILECPRAVCQKFFEAMTAGAVLVSAHIDEMVSPAATQVKMMYL